MKLKRKWYFKYENSICISVFVILLNIPLNVLIYFNQKEKERVGIEAFAHASKKSVFNQHNKIRQSIIHNIIILIVYISIYLIQ